MKTKTKKRFADGGQVATQTTQKDGSYTDGAFGASNSADNPYTYGLGPEKLYEFNRPTNLVDVYDPVAAAKQGYGNLSDSAKFYLRKKWGLWDGTEGDTGEKGVADTLSDINKIISYKGGSPVSSYSQVDTALGPLIAKRNAKVGLSGILKMAAPIVLSLAAPGIGSALGITSLMGTTALGAGLGAVGGAISGGGLKGALLGGAMGGFGNYLGAGGLSQINNAVARIGVSPSFVGPLQGPFDSFLSQGTTGKLSSITGLASKLGNVQGLLSGSTAQQGGNGNISLTPDQYRQLMSGQQQQQSGSYGVSPLSYWQQSRAMAEGGMVLRNYRSGGGISQVLGGSPRLIRGPGDGMSDGVQASINGSEPALLSDSEHVTPALQVSLLGRGSPKAGSERMEAIIDRELRKMYGKNLNAKRLQDNAMDGAQ